MRTEHKVTQEQEAAHLMNIQTIMKDTFPDLSAENTLVVMVSPDYSATFAMHIAHALSVNGEMCDILPIHVNYPDEDKEKYVEKAKKDLLHFLQLNERRYSNYLLVEAAVIQGGTFTWLTELFKKVLHGELHTVAMYENIHSKFKCNHVFEYYDNQTQDLTFYFEQYNRHWN